jgi:hypothetical protein
MNANFWREKAEALAQPDPRADEDDCDHMPWCCIRKICLKRRPTPVIPPEIKGNKTLTEQEPVAWIRQRDNTLAVNDGGLFGSDWTPLYSAAPAQPEPVMFNGLTEAETNESASVMGSTPPQREPLTEEEIVYLWEWSATAEAERTASTQQHAFARAIERAHGIGGEHE